MARTVEQRVDARHDSTDDIAAAYFQPRTDLLIETQVEPGCFRQERGPFTQYERSVRVDGDGNLTQRTTYHVAIPLWGVLFALPIRRTLSRAPGKTPWWAPPDPVDARAATVLSVLAVLSLVAGYLGTLIAQTITFAVEEFDADNSAQGFVLAATRFGVLLALGLSVLADRRGRRLLLLFAAFSAVLVTATGALAPSLAWLGASQTVARGLTTGLGVMIPIAAAEEMPAGARAYALSVLALAAGLGAGMAVWALPLADLGIRAWRLLYVLPGLYLLPLLWCVRHLPETRRYERTSHRGPAPQLPWDRLALLATAKFFGSMFAAPASQFQNEYLRDERGYSAGQISAFTLVTQTPASAGLAIGGRLADTRGRRILGASALSASTFAAAIAFQVSGVALWVGSFASAIIGAMTVPALSVYSPELFATQIRGKANGLITVASVLGSSTGLIFTGIVADRVGRLGVPIAILAIGPLIYAGLVLWKFPETANRRLEDINPDDEALAPATSPTADP